MMQCPRPANKNWDDLTRGFKILEQNSIIQENTPVDHALPQIMTNLQFGRVEEVEEPFPRFQGWSHAAGRCYQGSKRANPEGAYLQGRSSFNHSKRSRAHDIHSPDRTSCKVSCTNIPTSDPSCPRHRAAHGAANSALTT